MCDTCGCNVTPGNRHLLAEDGRHAKGSDGRQAVEILQSLLSENDHQAAHNRQHFEQHGVLAVNLMSSPGSGKTALLEQTLELLRDRLRVAVIVGDLETENDAVRLRQHGVTAVQISTGSACHLDAHMVHSALHEIDLSEIDLLFIENVGNLVCPASFDLGHHRNVILLSTTEGDDKPAKYPVMFRAADLMLISKCDLLEVLDDFSPQRAMQQLQQLANPAPTLQLSAKRGSGMAAWIAWLQQQLDDHRQQIVKDLGTLPPEHSHHHHPHPHHH
ncbi:MAG: hydrogenase nickel incorporation protein HypB [Gammaproteobacteria bacterium]|nr:hydrogenase nickel incorporation protein HypB [Gammaproteobacteria bacterium]